MSDRVFRFGPLTARQTGTRRVVFRFDSEFQEGILDVEFIGSGCLLPLRTKQAIMGAIRDILVKELQKQDLKSEP